jgi:DNA-binding response OmpR family regulator
MQAIDPARARILVADGDLGNRDFIAAALTAWGFTVTPTDRADEAVAYYQTGEWSAAFVDRSILAADLEAWRAARRADKGRVPLVAMSMAADEGDVERFGHEQASAVLVPPFQLRALRAALEAVVVK